MADRSFDTRNLRRLLDRIEAGDAAAHDELLRASAGRLERLARKMLRRFPGVRRLAQTDDVLQNALLRLLKALKEVRPNNTREYFGLAAAQIRRELLDLARHFYGPHGQGAKQARPLGPPGSSSAAWEPADDRDASYDDLDRWCAFHQGVEQLPAEEREVVSLVFYHGWKQVQVAEFLGIGERTVRRRWQAAMARLHRVVNEDL
jgi:RNA polymerase sigma-70 factor (ECF subfamily)